MRRVLALLSAAFLVLTLAAPASAVVSTKWDRLNPGADPANPAEHERFTCVGGDSWSCRYYKLPEPKLAYHWDRTTGVFRGVRTTDPRACPVGLVDNNGRDLCTDSHVTKVIAGRTTYVAPDGSVFTWDENLILTDAANGWAPLYMYLVPFGLACPWYGSFGDALEANPAGAFDCIAAIVTGAWRAKIGGAGINGTATIQTYTTGSGSLTLKLARLKPAISLPVTLSKGTCASVGSTLITLPAIRTTSTGTAARTSSLTVAQVTKIKAATARHREDRRPRRARLDRRRQVRRLRAQLCADRHRRPVDLDRGGRSHGSRTRSRRRAMAPRSCRAATPPRKRRM